MTRGGSVPVCQIVCLRSLDKFDARPVILAFATDLHTHQIKHEVLTGGFDGGAFFQIDALAGFEQRGEFGFQAGFTIELDQVFEGVFGLATKPIFDDFGWAGERNRCDDGSKRERDKNGFHGHLED
jgi:hypothetical protein